MERWLRVHAGVDLGLVTVCLVKNYGKGLACCIVAEAERRGMTVKELVQERISMLNKLAEEPVVCELARRVGRAWLRGERHAVRRLERVFRLRVEVWDESGKRWPGVGYYLPVWNRDFLLEAVRVGEPFVLLEEGKEVICLGGE